MIHIHWSALWLRCEQKAASNQFIHTGNCRIWKYLALLTDRAFVPAVLQCQLMNILEVAKVMVSASQTWCWDSPHVGQNRRAHPSVGIQPTYISEVQCSSACEKEAERADHLARVDRLAWQTSINTTWGSGSHCNEQQRVRSWGHRATSSRKVQGHLIWEAECQVWTDKQLN